MLKQITWIVGFVGAVTLASANSGPGNLEPVIHLGKPSSRTERVPRVVNRTITDSTVMLFMQTQKKPGICTGTLIAPHLILTAAHCVEKSPERIDILFYKGPGRFAQRAASAQVIHPFYNSGNEYDLALVYFEGAIPSGHVPAKLMNVPEGMLDTFFFDQPSLAAGYGITAHGKNDAGILRQIQLKYSGHFNDTLAMVDLENGNSLCHGDSGGPIFAYYKGEYRVWGVASFVDEPLCLNHSYYTLVMPHMKWIVHAAGALLYQAKAQRQ